MTQKMSAPANKGFSSEANATNTEPRLSGSSLENDDQKHSKSPQPSNAVTGSKMLTEVSSRRSKQNSARLEASEEAIRRPFVQSVTHRPRNENVQSNPIYRERELKRYRQKFKKCRDKMMLYAFRIKELEAASSRDMTSNSVEPCLRFVTRGSQPGLKRWLVPLDSADVSSETYESLGSCGEGDQVVQQGLEAVATISTLGPKHTPPAHGPSPAEHTRTLAGSGASGDSSTCARRQAIDAVQGRVTPSPCQSRRRGFRLVDACIRRPESVKSLWLCVLRDTGASKCVIKASFAKALGWEYGDKQGDNGCKVYFKGVGKRGCARSLGCIKLEIDLPIHRKRFRWRVHVIHDDDLPGGHSMLLSEWFCQKGGLFLDGLSLATTRRTVKRHFGCFSKPHYHPLSPMSLSLGRSPFGCSIADRMAVPGSRSRVLDDFLVSSKLQGNVRTASAPSFLV